MLESLTDQGFVRHDLDGQHVLYSGRVPDELLLNAEQFQQVWDLHPPFHHKVLAPFTGWVEIKRWQQSWGADYRFAGTTLEAAGPIPSMLQGMVAWACRVIDPRLNGVLGNFYEGPTHYISQHNDDTRDLLSNSPIVTISFGETRPFRLTKDGFTASNGRKFLEFPAADGCVFVMPFATNDAWKHGVPARKSHHGRRISITLRAFQKAAYPWVDDPDESNCLI